MAVRRCATSRDEQRQAYRNTKVCQYKGAEQALAIHSWSSEVTVELDSGLNQKGLRDAESDKGQARDHRQGDGRPHVPDNDPSKSIVAPELV